MSAIAKVCTKFAPATLAARSPQPARTVAYALDPPGRIGTHRSCLRAKKPRATKGPKHVLDSIGAKVKEDSIELKPQIFGVNLGPQSA